MGQMAKGRFLFLIVILSTLVMHLSSCSCWQYHGLESQKMFLAMHDHAQRRQKNVHFWQINIRL